MVTVVIAHLDYQGPVPRLEFVLGDNGLGEDKIIEALSQKLMGLNAELLTLPILTYPMQRPTQI